VSTETTETWLTQEAFDRRSAELELLSSTGRTDIAKKIEAAREEGDLKENGGYHAAKEEQGKMEARIRVLTELLRHATVGAAPTSTGVVQSGTVVSARILGDTSVFSVKTTTSTSIARAARSAPQSSAMRSARRSRTSRRTARRSPCRSTRSRPTCRRLNADRR